MKVANTVRMPTARPAVSHPGPTSLICGQDEVAHVCEHVQNQKSSCILPGSCKPLRIPQRWGNLAGMPAATKLAKASTPVPMPLMQPLHQEVAPDQPGAAYDSQAVG